MSQGRLEALLRRCQVYFKTHQHYLKISAIFLSFAIPFILLYNLHPQSFNETWKGRTFYVFFLWLIMLEIVLSWDEFKSRTPDELKPMREGLLGIALLIPTLYVVFANYFGLNTAIIDISTQWGVTWTSWMPLAVEYLAFTISFVVIALFAYGFNGVKFFSISAFFLGLVGMIYLVDNYYPHGQFTPFQILVPTTASFAANFLNILGYQTSFGAPREGMPLLTARNEVGHQSYLIAWPCSGVQSLLIYTVVMLLFLKKTNIHLIQKAVYFAFGAVVTYFINILRIASIFIIAINYGKPAAVVFHNYYGELYSMVWIIAYPLLIIGSRMLWLKLNSNLPGGLKERFAHRPALQNSAHG
jgi:thaumarchaeosortase